MGGSEALDGGFDMRQCWCDFRASLFDVRHFLFGCLLSGIGDEGSPLPRSGSVCYFVFYELMARLVIQRELATEGSISIGRVEIIAYPLHIFRINNKYASTFGARGGGSCGSARWATIERTDVVTGTEVAEGRPIFCFG